MSSDAPSWFFAGYSAAPNDGQTSGHDRHDRKTLRQGPGRYDIDRRTRIRSDHHTLESPIAAEDLCTWLELLTGFAGTDLLQLKAIVSVEGWPGPVLLYGEQNVFSALPLTEWLIEDHRTRIALVTRNLNEDCLRDLLAILTLAGSSGCRSKIPAVQASRDRATGRR
ncbi:GTP-binding protein [Bradyrhizobium sp. ARR65]|uniref:GTP-binding protein n=1 Tax=Bradyrhizobium sp. ARR65 TaxID=1040989 RepID=UPI000A03F7B8|nr:GTP-binding protein [Bradyrhizobium sp. ARR65]